MHDCMDLANEIVSKQQHLLMNALCVYDCFNVLLIILHLASFSPEGKDVSTSTTGGGNITNNNNGNNNNNGGSPGAASGAGTPSSNNSGTNQPKWPIKPGVHLHVNGLHSLGKSVKPINGFSYGTKHSTSTLPHNASSSSANNALQSNGNFKTKAKSKGTKTHFKDISKHLHLKETI
jgi:hypothetical protein